ncbi:MAG: zinc-binding dehydrogenase [Anaerolineae bacterium]|nr:zinc-binding dehydrogenase [Anaerolineae bacterium]
MRQVLITRAGPPDVLRITDGPDPEPKSGEVRIRVAAIGINFADIMGRLGIYPDAPKIPYVPGYEVAGVIDAVGPGGDPALVGTDVFALTAFGGYRDVLCVPAAQAVPRPANMTVEQASGFSLVHLTAYAALVALARVRPGDRVLIHAAAGGVGLAAVDICRIFHATVYGTASAHKHDFLRDCGVQFPIDYHTQNVAHTIQHLTGGRGVDVALDPLGGRSWRKSYRMLAPAGRMVVYGISNMAPGPKRSPWAVLRTLAGIPWLRFNPVALTSDNKGVMGLNMAYLQRDPALLRGWLDQLLAWYGEGRLRVHVDRVFVMDEVADAHRYIQERRNIGKVILKPRA